MIIGIVVHPVNTEKHPTVPAGFRWACHIGEDWPDMSLCLNAGWAPTQSEAAIAGEAAGVCALKVARFLTPGVECTMPTTVLDTDPTEAEADTVTIEEG